MRGPPLAALCVMGGIAVTGCALLGPPPAEPDKEVLAALPAELPARPPRVATVLVSPPDASAIYDTTQMAYVQRPGQISYFSRTEWAARPAEMIKGLLVRTLDKTGYVSAVVTPPFVGRAAYTLRTEIMALESDFTTEPATFHLLLRESLASSGSDPVVATREIEVREPLQEKSPHGGAVAANAAMAKALREVVEFVYAHLN
jgi:cholesterol transport system auxiliary component